MINKDTLRRWWEVFIGDGSFTEVRILGRVQYSGYFKSLDNLIAAIEPYSNMDDEQLYFVLNTIDDSCYGRQQSERIIKAPKITTNDNDIVHRDWVMCDFDPVRKSGVNSSDEEFELAQERAREVFRFLREKGFSEPVICKSGNGLHLQYRIDEPVTDEVTEAIKGFFKYMSMKFSDDKVDFDEKNFNAARLCKLYGTMAKKGANIQDRPWRMSEIIYVPKEIKPTPIEKFKELAALVPKDEPKSMPNRNQFGQLGMQQFDLERWLNSFNIKYRTKKSGGSTLYELYECPWIDQHSDRKNWDSALFVDQYGKITFNCTHSHCKGRTWQDVRLFYEPDAYRKREQYQQGAYPNNYNQIKPQPPKKQYEIKDELPELGGKWLSMSAIKKIDLSTLEKVKTGFRELDRAIVGLHMGEVTLISGSNSSGKSSWLNSLLLNIVNQGAKTALWSGELRPDILKTWVQMVAAGKRNLRLSQFGDGKYYVPNDKAEMIDTWLDGFFFLYNNEYGNTWAQIIHDMTELLKVGVKVFALDNLFSLDIDLFDGDRNNKQKELILQIKAFASKNNCHIMLVAHPRKVTTFLRKNDISGTGDLANAVDNIFILHRVNQVFFRTGAEFYGKTEIQRFQGYGNVLEVCKNRLFGVVDLMVGMYYEMESRRFKNDMDENVMYNWESMGARYVPPPQEERKKDEVDDSLFTMGEDAPF